MVELPLIAACLVIRWGGSKRDAAFLNDSTDRKGSIPISVVQFSQVATFGQAAIGASLPMPAPGARNRPEWAEVLM